MSSQSTVSIRINFNSTLVRLKAPRFLTFPNLQQSAGEHDLRPSVTEFYRVIDDSLPDLPIAYQRNLVPIGIRIRLKRFIDMSNVH
ncbi:hypothetical protein [Leptospira kirschneri]|uniref:hypothetical protein n=1 Tax=Leptospira kirschneri TaxID=29507 RepID=UPI003564D90D